MLADAWNGVPQISASFDGGTGFSAVPCSDTANVQRAVSLRCAARISYTRMV